MDDIAMNLQQVVLQAGVQPKPGAVAAEDGSYAPEDMEVFVKMCVPCIKAGAQVVDKDGKTKGALVPVVVGSRPVLEIKEEANRILNPRPALVAV